MEHSKQRPSDKRKREASPSSSVTPAKDSIRKTDPAQASMQPLESKRRKTASEPFDSLLQDLKPLGEKDPEIPAQATRLVSLYRNLWETYAATCSNSQDIMNENRRLEQSNKQLCQEREQMECRFHKMLKGMADIFESLGNDQLEAPRSFRKSKEPRE